MPARPSTRPLAHRLQRTRDTASERWTFRFNNGLVVHTDPFMYPDPARVSPVGAPHDAILSRFVHAPEVVANKRVLDVFAGCGVLGLMALRLGAAHVDFVDARPRAQRHQLDNCRANGFAASRFGSALASIADFPLGEPYDLVLSVPPCVPAPALPGIAAANGGPDGHQCLEPLFARLDAALRSSGEAYLWLMQFVDGDRPSIGDAAVRCMPARTIEFAPMQSEVMALGDYVAALGRCFPANAGEITRWEAELRGRYSAEVGLQHHFVHVHPKREGGGMWTVRSKVSEDFGEGLPWPAAANRDLALARVMELVVPVK